MATYQQWSGHYNSRGGGDGRYRVDQITALSARAAKLEEAMQQALIKMSMKADSHRQPQPCVMCGDMRHSYEYCPLAEWDEEPEQVNYLSNYNRNFYNNAPCNISNNHAFQSDPPEPYIDPAVSDFMHEQRKMNQMMLEQMQAINAQLVARSKVINTLMAKAIALQSGTQYEEPANPTDQTAADTTRVPGTRPVSAPPVEENPDHADSTRPPVNTDRADSTRTVQPPPYQTSVPFPQKLAEPETCCAVNVVETSELESVCVADAKTDNLEGLRHGSHTDPASHSEEKRRAESDKADTRVLHGSNTSDTDRAKAQTEQPTPELKPLPTNLRYEFLDPDKSCPVIVNADLNPDRTATLLGKLNAHISAIGCSIKDLKDMGWIFLLQVFENTTLHSDPPPDRTAGLLEDFKTQRTVIKNLIEKLMGMHPATYMHKASPRHTARVDQHTGRTQTTWSVHSLPCCVEKKRWSWLHQKPPEPPPSNR